MLATAWVNPAPCLICSLPSEAEIPRLSRIMTDLRPRPVTMELVIYSTDCPVCCALSWANWRYLPRSSSGMRKSLACTAAFMRSRSVTVPLVALRRLSRIWPSSSWRKARVTPSAAFAISTPSAATLRNHVVICCKESTKTLETAVPKNQSLKLKPCASCLTSPTLVFSSVMRPLTLASSTSSSA